MVPSNIISLIEIINISILLLYVLILSIEDFEYFIQIWIYIFKKLKHRFL